MDLKLLLIFLFVGFLAVPVMAGGPVIEDGTTETVVVEKPRSGLVPVIAGLVIACIIFCGGGDNDPSPPVVCNSGC